MATDDFTHTHIHIKINFLSFVKPLDTSSNIPKISSTQFRFTPKIPGCWNYAKLFAFHLSGQLTGLDSSWIVARVSNCGKYCGDFNVMRNGMGRNYRSDAMRSVGGLLQFLKICSCIGQKLLISMLLPRLKENDNLFHLWHWYSAFD